MRSAFFKKMLCVGNALCLSSSALFAGTEAAELGAAGFEVFGEEDVVAVDDM